MGENGRFAAIYPFRSTQLLAVRLASFLKLGRQRRARPQYAGPAARFSVRRPCEGNATTSDGDVGLQNPGLVAEYVSTTESIYTMLHFYVVMHAGWPERDHSQNASFSKV